MDNLRLTLLIIGCLMIMGIYLWEVFYKGTPKKKTDILNVVDETPDIPTFPNNEPEIAIDNYADDALVDLESFLTEPRIQNIDLEDDPEHFNVSEESTSEEIININEEVDDALPLAMSVTDYEASLAENNEPDIFSALEEELYGGRQEEPEENIYSENTDNTQQQEAQDTEAEVEIEEEQEEEVDLPQGNKANDDILVLYITSPSHISFNGLSISKATDEVGMIYGHMNIFHHFGPGKLHSGQPLFSLANMHEPGSFDLGRMADLKTKGLAVFMYSPASIDASVVFELYLNTTQRLAEILGGKVRDSDNEILNNAAISSLREKAESLSVN